MKVWYKVAEGRNRVGFITDIYDEYYKIQDEEDGGYYIVHRNDISPANNKTKTIENYIEL